MKSASPPDALSPPGSLAPFFRPRSVAVVGASRDANRIGHRLLQAIVQGGFQGAIYPVNPTANEILGLRAYPSVLALPAEVDLAIVTVPPAAAFSVVEDCGRHKIPALIVITAGFAEIGDEGRRLQDQLLDRVRALGMRMIGPNCLGVLVNDAAVRLNATFVPLNPPPGKVAMSTDSGALGLALLAEATRAGLGIASCVSVGNRADVSSNDLLEFWEDDPRTGVIVLYLESFGNPRRFARIARRVSRRKPIVAVKAGRTVAGTRAAVSHTAALAASDVAVDALFRQTGVLRAETLEETLDLVAGLSQQPLPLGRRVAIVTNAGGPAILCADACEAGGLVLPQLSMTLQNQLATFLPATASRTNPIDLIASATPEQYAGAIALLWQSMEVDAIIVIYVDPGVHRADAVTGAIGKGLATAGPSPGGPKTLLGCWMPHPGMRTLVAGAETFPSFPFPEKAARVLSQMAAYAEWRRKPSGGLPTFPDIALAECADLCLAVLARHGPGWMPVDDVRRLLNFARFPLAPGGLAPTPDEACALASAVGFPVAIKLASTQIVHKTEAGGIRLNVADVGSVVAAFSSIQDRLRKDGKLDAMEGVLVQPMIDGGAEVLIGMTHDPLFGPLIAFGLGGIHVEILRDVCFRVTPLTDRDAAEMVTSIRGYPLLKGYRGYPAADVPALEELLLRLSCLVEAVPEIQELELNPVFALPPGQGCRIVDARIRLAPSASCVD